MRSFYILCCLLLVLAGGCKEKKMIRYNWLADLGSVRDSTELFTDSLVQDLPNIDWYHNALKRKDSVVWKHVIEMPIYFPKRKNGMVMIVPYLVKIVHGHSGPEAHLMMDTVPAELAPVDGWGVVSHGPENNNLLANNTGEADASLQETRILMRWTDGTASLTGGDDTAIYKPGQTSLGKGIDLISAERSQNNYYAYVRYTLRESPDHRLSIVSKVRASDSGILRE